MRILVGVFLAAMGLAAAAAAAPEVKITLPFDGAVVTLPRTLVQFRTPSGYRPEVRRGDEKLVPFEIAEDGDVELHHIRLTLAEGANLLVWTDPASEKELGRLTIHHRPPQSMKKILAPGAREFSLHVKANEDVCRNCHELPATVETDAGEAGKVCVPCHPAVAGAKALHKPAAEHECFRCHQTAYNPNRFRVELSEGTLCDGCHVNFLARTLGEAKFVHGPVAAGGCLICHDPHGRGDTGMLRETPRELCALCHEDAVQRFSTVGVHVKPECIGCHSPHSADNAILVSPRGNELCLTCHPDPAAEMGGHPLPGHPVAGPIDPSRPGSPFRCTSCHTVHGARDITQMNILDDEAAQRKFCNRCHG